MYSAQVSRIKRPRGAYCFLLEHLARYPAAASTHRRMGGIEVSTIRTALVTGAASGIGSEIVLALAREGFDIAVAEISTDRLSELSAHPGLSNRKVVPVGFDLADPASVTKAFDTARAALGEI